MSKNALIVDDSRLACKVMSNMLEGYNISSVSVYSAEEALEFLQHNQPDMIFLDHSMPGMDGLETIKVIKSNPKTAMVPVMMYTAKEGEVYVGQARALGAVDVLPKGLEKEHLHNALQKMGMLDKPNPNKGKKAVEQIRKSDPKQPPKPPKTDNRSLLQNFWSLKVEPYLNRQKVTQSEELHHSTRTQTRRLTREMHQTLESFEHALMQRMESHDDFLNAQQKEISYRRKRWVSAAVVAFIVIQAFLLRELWLMSESNRLLLASQESQQQRFDQMDHKLAQLKLNLQQLQSKPVQVATENQTIWLADSSGEKIADVAPIIGNEGLYQAVTSTGYYFKVDKQAQITSLLEEQFYLTADCQGDRFVKAEPANLLMDVAGQFWYVDRFSQALDVTVQSKMNYAGECVVVDDTLLQLRNLQANHSIETGIDGGESYQLNFN
ncbi:MAG: response regulator [Kangiellaceae bacterium]|nr:response regulator [Kangiellaceae bacterium]